MSRSPSDAPSHFPHWVALGSLAFVLWLFFSNMVPALQEKEQLLAREGQLVQLRKDYDAAIQEARLGVGPNAHFDLQALLVAIDQHDLTPLELCLLHPERQVRLPVGEPGDPTSDPDGDSPAPTGGTGR
ncbi:MAG: hypothetical protein JNK15_16670 [Planctomycetes bacterium]|nr:hypothetical protein [Planctomycetota bacterium]